MDNYYSKMVSCEWCGKRFMDDCGDAFCSSSCEREYIADHGTCEGCGEVVGEENLNGDGYCETCEEELEDEE